MAATDNGPIIICKDLCVSYGREEALRNVNIEIDKGSFVPFVGPNGAGKTTLLRAILGLIKPSRGEVVTPFRRSPPGYVPQHNSIGRLYPVSALQIVMMGLYHRLGPWRRPSGGQKRRTMEVLEQFGLAGHAHKTFHELSGGMKQKALVARAFISGAEVFVMDEPTSGLDDRSEKEVIAQLVRLSREEGKTVLLALHGADKIASLASQICMVHHGSVRMAEAREAVTGEGG
jgi:ABC-type Mn2+/Zn2+ transport system ATPase subunit